MPIYDRQCNVCEQLFEVVCKISEKTLPQECPNCGACDGTWRMSAPNFTMRSERLMTHRKDNGFGEVLDKVKERNPRTPLATGRPGESAMSL